MSLQYNTIFTAFTCIHWSWIYLRIRTFHSYEGFYLIIFKLDNVLLNIDASPVCEDWLSRIIFSFYVHGKNMYSYRAQIRTFKGHPKAIDWPKALMPCSAEECLQTGNSSSAGRPSLKGIGGHDLGGLWLIWALDSYTRFI